MESNKIGHEERKRLMEVLTSWDLTPVGEIQVLGDGVFRFVTDRGNVLVLKDHGIAYEASIRQLEFYCDVLQHLDAAGISVPVPLRDKYGQVVVQRGAHLFTLSPCLPSGSYPTSAEGRAALSRNYGNAIAKLHVALSSYPQERMEGKVLRENLAENLDGWISTISSNLNDASWVNFRAIIDPIREQMHEALKDLPEQLVHRDCHPGNVLSVGTEVTGFVDCDHFRIGPRIVDIAYFLVQSIKRHVADSALTDRWMNEFPLFLEGYNRVIPISERERAAFPFVLMAIPLMFASWFIDTSKPGKVRAELDSDVRIELDALAWIHENLQVIRRQCGAI